MTEPNTAFADFLAQLKPVFSSEQLAKISRAYALAESKHAGQKRLSGAPYIEHSLETARILHALHSDSDTIAAGLLHDTMEDTDITKEEIEAGFGEEIAQLVEGVTKISITLFRDSEEQKAENLRKIMLAMVRDIRVIVIKLADRLHNMRTLAYLPDDKKLRIAKETLEIYAPLAHRLGIGRIKNELEDLAFFHLHPQDYQRLVADLAAYEGNRNQTIEEVIARLKAILAEVGTQGQVHGRMKHLYSIWNKMVRQEKELGHIYDIMAIRVLVPSLKDCYAVLGMVHAEWKPLPGRFKDFIAMPKSNMYQSLHTTIITPAGEPLEIQIRTEEMHQTAEEGIAAHWSYKEGNKVDSYASKLGWLRQFLEWQQETRDSKEFMESLKIDLFEDEVVVFTPKGEVKSLRKGATPVDFAYSVHSGIGDRAAGAKVNGRMVPLKYELKNGDIIEIITRSDSHPSRDWLNFVKTTKAKNRVRHYFRQQEREEKIKQGKVMLEAELERCGANPSEVMKKETLQDTAQKLNLRSLEELLIQIGDGNLAVKTVAAKLGFTAPLAQMPKPGPVPSAGTITKTSDGIAVSGLEGLVVRFAQCCHPIPGDPIEGYITQGRGVSIHRKDCPNLHAMRTEPGRSIQVAWSEVKKIEHALQLIVTAQDRERLLADMLQVFYDSNTTVKGANTRIIQGNLVEAVFTVQVADLRHLETLMRGLRRVKNVVEVGRKGNF